MRTVLWVLLLSLLPVAAFGLDAEVFVPVLALVCAVAGLTAPEAVRADGAATGEDPGRGSRPRRVVGLDRREGAALRSTAKAGAAKTGSAPSLGLLSLRS